MKVKGKSKNQKLIGNSINNAAVRANLLRVAPGTELKVRYKQDSLRTARLGHSAKAAGKGRNTEPPRSDPQTIEHRVLGHQVLERWSKCLFLPLAALNEVLGRALDL